MSKKCSKKYQPFRFFSLIFYLCNFSDPFMSNYSVPFMCCSNFQSTAMFEGSECVQEEEEGGSTGSTVASSISACKKVKTGLVSYSLFSRPTTVNICLIRRTAHPSRFVYKNKERGAAGAQLTGLRWRPGWISFHSLQVYWCVCVCVCRRCRFLISLALVIWLAFSSSRL